LLLINFSLSLSLLIHSSSPWLSRQEGSQHQEGQRSTHLFTEECRTSSMEYTQESSLWIKNSLHTLDFVRQPHAWQRDQLFGDQSESSSPGRTTPYDPSRMTDREMHSLESQNDDAISGLHSKVAMLKKVESILKLSLSTAQSVPN
jgi:hypothetical protein